MRWIYFIGGFVWLLTGCVAGDVVVENTRNALSTAEPTETMMSEVTAVATSSSTTTPLPYPLPIVELTNTAIPYPFPIVELTTTPLPYPMLIIELTATPTATPSSMPSLSWTPTSDIMLTAAPNKIPDLVWFKFRGGSHTDPPTVLAVRSGVAAYEPFPMDFTSFWDYSPLSGQVAFSDVFWQASPYGNKSVTNLWIYNYETGQMEMWFPDNVSGAGWSKNIHPQTGSELLAVAVYTENRQYDLLILSGPGNVISTIPDASPQFSWSPDGQWIAFFRSPGVYVVPAIGGQEIEVTGSGKPGWVLERPLWAQEHQAIIDSLHGLRLSFINGAETIKLRGGPDPYKMLWDPHTRQIIAGYREGMEFPEEIRVFQLSKDLRTITGEYVLAEGNLVQLADWLVPGEKLLLSDGRILDWPVEDQ